MHARVPRTLCALTVLTLASVVCAAQQPPAPAPPSTPSAAASPDPAPLPDIRTLLDRVRARYNELESLRKNYIFTITQVADEFASDGSKKSHTDTYEAFYVANTEVRQHTSRDGKPLSAEDARKEQQRVDKEVAELKSHAAKAHRDEVKLSASGLLKVASFTNPRRELIDDRPVIVFDYTGDAHAHAENIAEQVMRQLAGTLWIDERDNAILRLTGKLQENFHVGGGLLVNIRKGSWFDFHQQPVNGEIWFPRDFTAHVDGRVLLLKGFNGDAHQSFSGYRKLRTTVTILPGSSVVVDNTSTPQPAAPSPASPTPPSPAAQPSGTGSTAPGPRP